MRIRNLSAAAICILSGGLFILAAPTVYSQQSSSLFVSAAGGTFTVGSVFTVSIFVNTAGQDVNAIEANLRFPPDKLQVVSATAGQSAVSVWVRQPSYDNRAGTLRFQGAIPTPGINTSQGLISEVTFRVTGVGFAPLRFEDTSQVLLNDGKGTNILGQLTSGLYHLVLPPPAGPIVVSQTHPDQESWYSNPNVLFEWASEENVQGYSYVLSASPIETPDDISEGQVNSQAYKNLGDGIRYFHIRSLREGTWGGVTHYGVKVDTSPPAHFPISLLPSPKTTSEKVTISFSTTDAFSGINHYELKIIALSLGEREVNRISSGEDASADQPFFIDAASPYIAELGRGDYDVVIRSYDKAGNYVQETARLSIVAQVFDIVRGEGLRIRSGFILPWSWVWMFAALVVLLLAFIAHIIWERHLHLDKTHTARALPEEVRAQLGELKALRDKHRFLSIGLFALFAFFTFSFGSSAHAVSGALGPPLTTQAPQAISNEEIFYVGGTTEFPKTDVIIYFQNLLTGETKSATTASDDQGEWFYSHPELLPSGTYVLWTQARRAEELSPPSAQIRMTVSPTALQFGASRVSFETLYLGISLILLAVIIGIGFYALYHYRHLRNKRRLLRDDITKAEESVRRGFAILKRDIEAELSIIKKARLSADLSREERVREETLLQDLERVQGILGREIWEIEKEIQ